MVSPLTREDISVRIRWKEGVNGFLKFFRFRHIRIKVLYTSGFVRRMVDFNNQFPLPIFVHSMCSFSAKPMQLPYTQTEFESRVPKHCFNLVYANNCIMQENYVIVYPTHIYHWKNNIPLYYTLYRQRYYYAVHTHTCTYTRFTHTLHKLQHRPTQSYSICLHFLTAILFCLYLFLTRKETLPNSKPHCLFCT